MKETSMSENNSTEEIYMLMEVRTEDGERSKKEKYLQFKSKVTETV